MFLKILLILLLVGANGFFVAAEFALVKLRLSEIKASAEAGSRAAKIVEQIVGRLDAYLSACQLGITLASLGLGWVGEPLVATSIEPFVTSMGIEAHNVHYIAFPLAFLLITFLHITAGEQVPKILAIQRHKPTSLVVALPLAIFYKVFKPFIWVLNTSSNLMLRAIGVRMMGGHGGSHTEDELRFLIYESSQVGLVSTRERVLMENVLDLEDRVARSVMLPRNLIVSVDATRPIEEQMAVVSNSGHTRIPICEGDLDQVIGMVHVKDVLRATTAAEGSLSDLRGIMRPVRFLPESVALDELLRTFQKERVMMALLVDEYGVVSGMITLENVLEQLVGAIQDEFDSEVPKIREVGAGQYEVAGSTPIDDVRRKLAFDPPPTSADTVGGLLSDVLAHIPAEGETVVLGRVRFTILEAEPTHVKLVRAERIEGTEDAGVTGPISTPDVPTP